MKLFEASEELDRRSYIAAGSQCYILTRRDGLDDLSQHSGRGGIIRPTTSSSYGFASDRI